MVHHHIQCSCLGADEACFANFIGCSESGNREEAMLLAATLVRPDTVPLLIDLAQNFALALKKMALLKNNFKARNLRIH
ncbi:MAG: hypothetical protein CML56_06225 [Rhodobacteraceae bacterium]|nr:hypothetical protein [Paracoccaceae bacterium]